MNDEDRLADLLLQWEEMQEQGRDVAAEELCRDCPHLALMLARRIHALKATSWLAEDNNDGGDFSEQPGRNSPPPSPLAGRYRLDEKIAEGGFAEVWRGFDQELQRAVAVKMPKHGRLPSTGPFMAEARRAARLKHPGVVPVFDVGQDNDTCFIVSEFVEGGSLADRITQGRTSPEEAVRLVAEVAETLAYAHRQGFVHRDIKPGNILLDHHGRALLADFGISRSSEDGPDSGTYGTLAYMSPEQVQGQPVDRRSDIYALGVVLYELLTGKLPHEAADPVDLRRLIASGTVVSIPKEVGVPKEGESICLKCLSRNPVDRYQDAAELAQELRRAVFVVRPNTTRIRLLVVGAVMFLLLGVFAVRGILDRDRPRGGAETRTTSESERRAVHWVYSVGGFANDTKRLDGLPEPWIVRSVYLHRDHCDDKVMDADLARLSGLPDLDTLNLGGAGIDGSGLAHLRSSGKLKWLSLECTRVDDAGLAHLMGFPDLTYLNLLSTPVTDASVEVLLKLTRLETVIVSGTKVTPEGVARLRKAVPSCRVVAEWKGAVEAALSLGKLRSNRKEWDKAEAAFTEAITLEGGCAEAYHRRAGSRFNGGKVKESLSDFDTAARLAPKNAEVFKHRGIAYLNLLQFNEALADLLHALELDADNPEHYRKVLGETHARRAYEHAQAKRFKEAVADFDEAIRFDLNNAGYFDRRGSVRFALSQFKEARKDFTEAIRLDPKQPVYYLHRGYANEALGDKDEAAEDYKRGKVPDPK
jgi:Flp pilus assembly protein TadD